MENAEDFLKKHILPPHDDLERILELAEAGTVDGTGLQELRRDEDLYALYCVLAPHGLSTRAEIAIPASRGALSESDFEEVWFNALPLLSRAPIEEVGIMAHETGPLSPSILTKFGFRPMHESILMKSNEFVSDAEIERAPLTPGFTWMDLSPEFEAQLHLLIQSAFPEHPQYRDSLEEFASVCRRMPIKPRILVGGGRCVGFIMVRLTGDGRGIIDLIGRDPSVRGKNLGQVLFYESSRLLKSHGAKSREGIVRVDNRESTALHSPHLQKGEKLTFWTRPIWKMQKD